MNRDNTLYLSDIVENMDDAISFLAGLEYSEFVNDKKTVNAVVRSIEIIGETTKQVPEEIKQRRPGVPWKNMAGMRDKCIHSYFGVDHEMVWNVVREDIPRIKPFITSLLEEIRTEQGRR